MSSIVLSGGQVFLNGKLEKKDILIEGERIAKIGENLTGEKIDCSGKIILPGAIDIHVHFRDFSESHKEDWESGSRAAAAGGTTTVFDMVNNAPPITTKERLFQKKELAKKSIVNYGLYFGLGPDNLDSLAEVAPHVCGFKLHMCKTTGDLLLTDPVLQKKAFEKVKETGKIIIIHAEDHKTLETAAESVKGRNDFLAHADSRPHDAEIKAVETAISFQKESGAKAHITHLTTARAAEHIRSAKNDGQNITCDTCPTYLFLTTKDLEEKGARAKMNPPVRDEKDLLALWKGIRCGEIDIISTDHAPHTIDEKTRAFFGAPAGVPGVEMRIPLLLDAVNKNKISLETFVKACATNPAKLFGLKERGELKEGNFADIIVVDMNLEKKVKREEQHTKCGWSPYEGMVLRGWPIITFVNGTVVYDTNGFYENEGENLFVP